MVKSKILNVLRAIMPKNVKRIYTEFRAKKFKDEMSGKSTEEVFTEIYRRGIWGRSRDGSPYYSGSGSHESRIIKGYVDAIKKFISDLKYAPDVVDLGCGDFTIGEKIRPVCKGYIACDIVEELIDYNRKRYSKLDVEFKCINIARNDLPSADVVLVRQVFQHLSNEEILKALEKIRISYSYLILTEHLPVKKGFTPNKDKPSGADIRTTIGSGVVLTECPFNFENIENYVIFEIEEENSLIRTTVFRIK